MIESRSLRYFVAVAEELHFARAAERLSIAPPALSRAIAQLETQLGVRLLERSTRRVELTAAGHTLLDEGRRALEAIEAAAHRARRAGDRESRLVLALKADLDSGLLSPILAAYHGPVEVQLCQWSDLARAVREGRADVALMPGPVEDAALDHEVLTEEPQVVVLPAAHPLAERPQLSLSDLDAALRRTTRPNLWTPTGGSPPAIDELAQLLWLVETGELVALMPVSFAERYPRPQLAYRDVADAPPATLTVVWPRASRSLSIAAFVRAASDVVARQGPDGVRPDVPMSLAV